MVKTYTLDKLPERATKRPLFFRVVKTGADQYEAHPLSFDAIRQNIVVFLQIPGVPDSSNPKIKRVMMATKASELPYPFMPELPDGVILPFGQLKTNPMLNEVEMFTDLKSMYFYTGMDFYFENIIDAQIWYEPTEYAMNRAYGPGPNEVQEVKEYIHD